MNPREFAALAPSVAAGAMSPGMLLGALQVDVNGERLNRHLAELSRFGANPSMCGEAAASMW